MKKQKKSRIVIDCILLSLIVIVALSNIFSKNLEILLKLKPNLLETASTQIHFIDVGQGDAIAIKFSNGKTMLVDSGTEKYVSKLENYLDNIVLKGSNKIDYLVLTHPDSDHSSNMDFIINNYEIGTFYRPKVFDEFENKEPQIYNVDYRNVIKSLENKDIITKYNENGTEIYEDGIKVEWIMPSENENIENTNDYSPVILIEDNGCRVLLTGDIGEDIENKLIDMHNNGYINLDVDILKLAHHGSKYSNSYNFLKITSPIYAVTSVGENTYGHPANEVIERLLKYDEEFDTNLYNNFKTTKEYGNIVYTLDTKVFVETISNIDDYIFISYWVYSLIGIGVLSIVILIPYFRIWYKNIRFILRNKKYQKDKEREKNISNG